MKQNELYELAEKEIITLMRMNEEYPNYGYNQQARGVRVFWSQVSLTMFTTFDEMKYNDAKWRALENIIYGEK